jgi:hypothetical protein
MFSIATSHVAMYPPLSPLWQRGWERGGERVYKFNVIKVMGQ